MGLRVEFPVENLGKDPEIVLALAEGIDPRVMDLIKLLGTFLGRD